MDLPVELLDNGRHVILTTRAPNAVFSPWRGIGSCVPSAKEIYALTHSGYEGDVTLSFDNVMSKRQLATCKRYVKTSIITATRGWSSSLARLAFYAIDQPFLEAPSRVSDKYFCFNNCENDSEFVQKLASQLATVIQLTMKHSVPIKISPQGHDGATFVGFDWDAVYSRRGAEIRDYHAAQEARNKFNQSIDHRLIEKYMKEAIADTRKALGFVTPEIPEKITLRIQG